jgi:hypothetical protein
MVEGLVACELVEAARRYWVCGVSAWTGERGGEGR